MSQEELVGAYVDGEISRRSLIKRLVAGGLTLGAASAYAAALAPGAQAGGEPPTSEYPEVTLKILSSDLGTVKNSRVLQVRYRGVSTGGPDSIEVDIDLIASVDGVRIGREILPKEESEQKVIVDIPLKNVNPLRGVDTVEVEVKAKHKALEDKFLLATTTKTLTKASPA